MATQKEVVENQVTKHWVGDFIQRFSSLAGLVLLFIFFSITANHFLSVNNLLTIALQTSIIAIVAIGETYVIIKAGIDLSVGAVVAISGVTAAEAMTAGLPIWLAIIIGIAVGTFCGVVNGLLIAIGKIPPFIATLGMMGMARGAALVITGGIPVSGFPNAFGWIGGANIFGVIPFPVIILAAVAIVMGIVLQKSRFGRNVYAIGSSEDAAFLSGIKVKWTKICVYGVGGLTAGVAGIILISRLISAQPTAGNLYNLHAIAAAVIGGTSLKGGVGTIIGTIIGAFIMGVLRNGLNLLGVSAFWQQFTIGAIVIVAVFIDQLRRRKR